MTQTSRTTPSPIEQMRRRERVGVSRTSTRSGKTSRRLSNEDERLLTQILAKEQDFIDSEVFYEEDAEETIYEDAPDITLPDTTWYHPVMDDISSISRTRSVKSSQQVILTGAEERVLFHQFNYARYRVWKLQQEVWENPEKKPTPEQADQILHVAPPGRADPRADRRDEPGAGARDGQADPHERGGLSRIW